MLAVVLVDVDRIFRGAFEEIFNCLQIKLWPLARGNHKVNSVESYHRFLKKTKSIAGQYRGIHDIFIQNEKYISVHMEQCPNQ